MTSSISELLIWKITFLPKNAVYLLCQQKKTDEFTLQDHFENPYDLYGTAR